MLDMKDIKSIEFIFENCECFTIDAKYFGVFEMSDIQTKIGRIAVNSIAKFTCANHVAMEIFSEADDKYNFYNEEMASKLERIRKHSDITSICLTYDDETEEIYYVNYKDETEGELGTPNVYQKTYLSKSGNLYLVISENNNIEDVFDMTELNDKTTMNLNKKMILM
jgi:hypothetical protein